MCTTLLSFPEIQQAIIISRNTASSQEFQNAVFPPKFTVLVYCFKPSTKPIYRHSSIQTRVLASSSAPTSGTNTAARTHHDLCCLVQLLPLQNCLPAGKEQNTAKVDLAQNHRQQQPLSVWTRAYVEFNLIKLLCPKVFLTFHA